MKTYRMLCNGETEWTGKARDPEHAEWRCFYDESPGSLCRYTLQVWGRVKLSRSISSAGWVNVYKNECLTSTY
jgi:hypothetical protein